MWDFESPRNKTTTFLHKASSCKKRLKSLSSNPYDRLSPNYNEQEIFQNNNTRTLGRTPKIVEFGKQQKKARFSPLKHKNKQNSHLQSMHFQAKSLLKKLCYKEKLLYIEYLLKSTRQLCKNYGYFSITFPMLKLTYGQQIKIQIWIHPDRRCSKPLHPIKKSTQFECQLSCVFDLKNLIKKLFPTIDLGTNKTFSTLIAHIDTLKLASDPKLKPKPYMRQNSIKTTEAQNTNIKTQQYYLNGTTKTIPLLRNTKQDNQLKNLQKSTGHKQNSMLETIGSMNSLKQRLESKKIKQVQELKKPQQLKQSLSSPFPEQNISNQKTSVSPNTVSPQKTNVKSSKNLYQTPNNRLHTQNIMKTSMTGQRFMTMSIQIESEINNLFGSEEGIMSNFYNSSSNKNTDIKNLKNSLLSRVAEEFEDLF